MYTKGKWGITKSNNKDYPLYVVADMETKPKGIALIKNHQPFSNDMEANAQLIASAPKMAKLLEYLVNEGWNAGVTEEAKEILDSLEV